jgi:hypothetical protein
MQGPTNRKPSQVMIVTEAIAGVPADTLADTPADTFCTLGRRRDVI